MAKGKKGKKAPANDDWENDVPQEAEDTFGGGAAGAAGGDDAAAAANGSAEPATASAADLADDFDGGGLLGAIKKNRDKKKKGKQNKNASDDQMASALAALTTNDAEGDTAAAPTEATEDDFGPVGKQKKGKGGKGGGGGNQAAAAPPRVEQAEDNDEDEDADGDAGSGKVLTKKEKEKLKKEREKQRKKEQAARKKAQGPAGPATPAEAEAQPSSDASAAAAAPSKPAAAAPEPAAAAATGKKKKVPAGLAALQRQQELMRQAEEEQRRIEEEEKRLQEEEEKRIAEEEKRKEEAKARKKEKEKEKKEQLKKEGKLLTKAQREAQQKQQLRLQQMIDAGMIVEGLVDPDAAKKKKPVYDKKKKPGRSKAEKEEEERKAKEEEEARIQKEAEEHAAAEKKTEENRKRAEEKERKAAEEAEAAKKAAKEDDVIDDWDAAVDEDGNLKESWDQDSNEDNDDDDDDKKKASAKEVKKAKGKKGAAQASDSESESDSEDETAAQKAERQRKEEAAERRKKQHEAALAARSKDNLRSPICCILGHVDTGKTKLLDKIRQTNVQEGEAGGITQQIGATYFPGEAIKMKTDVVNEKGDFEIKVPGLLIIDTPGHESFTNLRSRGSSLCNIAILVVDIMHGLEPQTLESIRLLRDRKTPFIVALNKIDRLYGWKATPNNGFRDSLSRQSKSVQNEFKDRLERTKLAFSEQSLNAELFYENKNMSKFVSLVPTSAHTGEGIPDMLKLLVSLTQQRMTEKLMYLSELECTVLEVKVIEGLGTTIDVVLSNGVLREGDRIVICGLNGAISTNVRALLTPQPLKELRVKGSYVHHKQIKAAMGIKIAANDLEDAIAGSRLMVVGPDDDEEDLEEEVMSDLEGLLSKVTKGGKGVSVQASTLGSLEALLEFLRVSNIPVMSISIGPVYKRDVMRCGTMLEKNKEFAVMLCFDVKVDKEAQAYAEEVGVKIFTADIIYHLFDSFTAYQKELLEAKREETKADAVFPCVLNTVAVFHHRDPIVVGVDCVEGSLRIGTPIATVKNNPNTGEREPVVLGRVTSIELNHKAVPMVKKGSPSVAVKIEAPNQPILGRHWEEKDTLYSHISRRSIDTLKANFREDVAKEDWQLLIQLKKVFKID